MSGLEFNTASTSVTRVNSSSYVRLALPIDFFKQRFADLFKDAPPHQAIVRYDLNRYSSTRGEAFEAPKKGGSSQIGHFIKMNISRNTASVKAQPYLLFSGNRTLPNIQRTGEVLPSVSEWLLDTRVEEVKVRSETACPPVCGQ